MQANRTNQAPLSIRFPGQVRLLIVHRVYDSTSIAGSSITRHVSDVD